MHKFLRAVGFSQYTEKKQVQKLIRDIIIHADERSYTTVGKKTLVAEFDRNFAEDIGIAVCGEFDEDVSYWMAGKPAVAAMGMRVNSIHALADAEDNAAMIVRYPDCYAVLEGTWTTYNHTFKSPIVYGTKGALVGDYKTGKVQFYHTDGTVEDIENDPLPEELKDVACAYVHHMDTDEPIHYTAQPEFNLDAMAILDAGIRSSDSGKIELVNNLHWQIG